MNKYHAEYLTRNDNGQFSSTVHSIVADSMEEAVSYLLHGERHGKWSIESDVTITDRSGENKRHVSQP
jgi:hypothetical protein